MNYFSRNRIITIVLIALMVINVVALITIASNSRIFRGDKNSRTETRSKKEGGSFRERGERFSRGMSRNLNLSDEQQAKMEELRNANHEKMAPIMARMDTLRRQLNEAMGSKEIDEAAIRGLNDRMVTLDRQIRDNLFEFNMGVRGMLDDEQLDKYLEMHRRSSRGESWQRRRGEQTNMIKGIY